MMRAAVPAYLGNDFSQAAPGHRFGLYYAGWNDDFTATRNKKTEAVQSACALPDHSQKLLAALLVRQRAQAEALGEAVLTLPCRATSPFATGLGNEHPLENGFSFLTPYGLPYLPGSGVKGVLRRAAEELASGEWCESQGWSEAAIRSLFGPGEEDPTRDDYPRQGALVFWDVFPQPKGSLAVEIMTPHLTEYYQGNDTPNTSLTPNPIPFLAVPAGSSCSFHIVCRPYRIPEETLRQDWKKLIEAAFAHAAKWLGFGAKTAVGYGRMAIDDKARRDVEEARQARAEREVHEQRMASLTPNQQRIEAFVESCRKRAEQLGSSRDRQNTALHNEARALVKAAQEGADWTAEEKKALADAIEEWLPKLIERMDAKEARKQLKLAVLRG